MKNGERLSVKMSTEFHLGDRVYYVSGCYSIGDSNPLKRTIFECQGTISRVYPSAQVDVEWDNGATNSYMCKDLEFAESNLNHSNPNTAFRSRKGRRS